MAQTRLSREIDEERAMRRAAREARLDWRAHSWEIAEQFYALMERKRHPLGVEDAATVAVERVATKLRKLAHDTGATDWRDRRAR